LLRHRGNCRSPHQILTINGDSNVADRRKARHGHGRGSAGQRPGDRADGPSRLDIQIFGPPTRSRKQSTHTEPSVGPAQPSLRIDFTSRSGQLLPTRRTRTAPVSLTSTCEPISSSTFSGVIRLWRPAERDVDVSRKYPPLRTVLKLDDVAFRVGFSSRTTVRRSGHFRPGALAFALLGSGLLAS
jgi:hypothetical protein